MATEPKTVRETNIRMDGADRQINLIQTLLWIVLGSLGAIFAGAIAIYVQVGEIKSALAVQDSKLEGISKRLATLEEGTRSRDARLLREIVGLGAKLDQRSLPGIQPLNLADGEITFLRAYFKIRAPTTAGVGNVVAAKYYSVGDVYSGETNRFPDDVAQKLPKLKGLNYTLDEHSGAMLITNAASAIVAIVRPA